MAEVPPAERLAGGQLAAAAHPVFFSLQRVEALKRLKWEDDRGWNRPGSGKALQTMAPDSVGGKCPK